MVVRSIEMGSYIRDFLVEGSIDYLLVIALR